MLNAIKRAWCKCMHDAPMLPINGWYRCRTCRQKYPVQWEQPIEGGNNAKA